jgi:guanylate kinase
MIKRGKILILVAPSGGGKSTMTNRLLKDFDEIRFSVSATTRKPREGEKNGVHYFFLSREEFRKKADSGEFLEWEEFYNGTMYGTLRTVVENDLNKGYFVLLDIDVLGAKNVKEMYGDEALAIFITPPSIDVLKQRLIATGNRNGRITANPA